MKTRTGALMLALALAAAACGGSDEPDATEAEATETESAEVETTGEAVPAEEPAVDDQGDVDEDVERETQDEEPGRDSQADHSVEMVPVRLGILGGITFDAPADSWIEGAGMFREIYVPDPEGSVRDVRFLIGRASQSGGGQPITTIEALLDHLIEVGEAEVTEGDDGIDLLGLQLRQFRVASADRAANFASEPVGFASLSGWESESQMFVYATELEDALLLVATLGRSETELGHSETLMRSVIPTISFAGDRDAIPPQQTPDDAVAVDLSNPYISAEAPAVDGGPPLLPDAFTMIEEAGPYQVLKLGLPLQLDLPLEWVVRPNFPGFVVLSDFGSRGPYRLDIRMHNDVELLVPLGDGHQPIGPGFTVAPIEDLLADPPPNLTISNVDREVSFAGFDTVAFDIALTDAHDCGPVEKPCEYAWTTPTSEGSTITGTFAHRVWVVEGTDVDPLVLQMSNWPEAAEFWFEQAEAVLSTAELLE